MLRDTIKRGPAVILINGNVFTPKSEVKLDLMRETFQVETSTKVQKSTRVKNVQHRISFTHDGRVTAGILAELYACQSYTLGQSVFGDADVPVVVHWKEDGETMTFPAGAITKPPDITISAEATLFGDAEITCLGASDTLWTDADKFLTIATGAYAEVAALGSIITESPTIEWGTVPAAPWDDVRTLDGIKIAFNLSLEADSENREGIFDYIFQGVEATATFTPRGITAAQLMTAAKVQGAAVRRGMSLNATSLGPMNASNSALYFRLYGAALTKYPLAGGSKVLNRIGEVSLISAAEDVTDKVFYVGAAAPV